MEAQDAKAEATARIEHALAQWTVGESETASALRAMCAAVEDATGAKCLLLRGNETLGDEAAGAQWTVRQPVASGETLFATLAACGQDEPTRLLVSEILPRTANMAAAILASDAAVRVASEAAHKMNNLLAAVLANVAFAVSVVNGATNEAIGVEPGDRDDLLKALQHTKDSANQLSASANRLVTIASRGR